MIVFDILNNFKEVTTEWRERKGRYWLILQAEELCRLQDVFLLEEECLQECRGQNQLTKLSFYDGYIFLICNILKYENKEVLSKELYVFLSQEFIITVCEKVTVSILQELIKDIENSKNCFVLNQKRQTSILLYYILDRVIIRNYDVISAMEEEADWIEINILKNTQAEQIEELIHLRRQVYKIRKYLNPLRYIGDSLVSNDNSIIEDENTEYFISLNNKIDKLMLCLESLVQDLAIVREAFEAETANKTTELMKVFTLIATIFLPLNLISSIYGMELKAIPFVEHKFGFYYIIIFMIAISAALIYLFKKKKWL